MMKMTGLNIDWAKLREKVDAALANEVKMDFCGHEIDVDKDTLAKYHEWRERVSLPLENQGAIGGQFTYCITPTSLGMIYIVEHSSGEEFNLTNFDLW